MPDNASNTNQSQPEKLKKTIAKLENENLILKEEKRLFTKTQELAKIGSWMIDLNTSKLISSDQLYHILEADKTKHELTLEDLQDFVHPDYREETIKAYQDSTKDIKNFDLEIPAITAKGKEKQLRVIGEFEYNKFKNPVLLSGLVIDITANVLFKEIELKFKTLFENAPDGIYITDKNGIISICNQSFAQSIKMDPAMVNGHHEIEFIKEKSLYQDQLYHLIKEGFTEDEFTEVAGDGTETLVWRKSISLYDKKKRFNGAISFSRDITRQKEAETALKNSEEKYRNLIDQAVDGIFISDEKGDFIIVNNSGAEITGYTKKELYGMNFADLFSEKELREKPLRYDLVEQKKEVTAERKVLTKKGKEVQVEMRTKMLQNGMIQSILRDNTAHKKILHELKESEERFKSLYNNSSIGLYRTTQEGKILMANPTLLNLLGYKSYDNLSKINAQKGIYKDPEIRKQMFKELEKKGEIKGWEAEWYKTDGSTIIIRENAKAFKDNSGKIMHVEGTIEDITDQIRTKKALQESEEHFRLLFENSPLGIFTAKTDGSILNANSALLDILGSPSLEATRSINILQFPPLVQNGFADDFRTCVEKAEVIRKEYYYTSKWGKSNYLWEHLFPLKKDGKVKLVYVIIENITHRKSIEQELIKAKNKAEESDKLKTSFLANMSHEIRTPMNSIIGFAELLSNPELDPGEQFGYVDIINQNANQLLQIINDVLDISRIEAGQINIKEEAFSINDLFDKLYDTFQKELTIKPDVKLIVNKTLSNEEDTVYSDQLRLWQIMMNLLNNAIKFTHEGFVEYGCYLPKENGNESLQFYIKDTGIGITKNKYEVIFEPFRQSDESDEKQYSGTGLGLSISKGLIQLLGGEIWVNSTPGQGSTFYFTIPYKSKFDKSKAQKTMNDNRIQTQDYDWSERTILVVEDNEPNFIYIREILKKTAVQIVRAISGNEAIDICHAQNIDLVLMDIRLPEMDGYEATRLIKKENPDLPVIAQTAYAMVDDRIKCFEAGCSGYFSKPINRKELLAMINNHFTGN